MEQETRKAYGNPLLPTSQFVMCGNCFRADMYKGCAFGCDYCFANDMIKEVNPSPTEIIILPGCDHGNGMYKQTEMYQNFIKEFLNKYL